MSEKINISSENVEIPSSPVRHPERSGKIQEKQPRHVEHQHKQNIEKIARKVETSSVATEKIKSQIKTEENNKPTEKYTAGKQLRENNLSHSLKKVRRELKLYQRPFSKLVHNDVVEAISEVGEKTIARPSGLLFGGIASLVTSVAVLGFSYYYGYEYNYLIGLVSFFIGFLVGIIGEFIAKSLRRS